VPPDLPSFPSPDHRRDRALRFTASRRAVLWLWQVSQGADHRGGMFGAFLNIAQAALDFLKIGVIALEPAQRGTGIGEDAGKRLVDLVYDRSGLDFPFAAFGAVGIA